ncbi:DUF4920 domain-containing protein [Sediminitomix flava]|uniref:Uncharacterized protein DUF4920 n=1 Tax=Sediminitomix flava TaxID=379075 RepID=A0A315YWH9_SEDFL|nr:DUF4920 domain-containing protein [Sediminitomix flava]PWJ34225.1 uncharacterized protein DUF4920 [Sediminitomix flava]
MKKLTIILFALFTLFACQKEEKKEFFGAEITADNILSDTELKSTIAANDVANVKIQGDVYESCAVKGCWMKVTLEDGSDLMVKFKDYGFFVPKGLESGKVIMEGELKKELIPVDELKHYAEDAGQSAEEIAKITEPELKLTMVADGVILVDGKTTVTE